MSYANARPAVAKNSVEQSYTKWPATRPGNIESGELQETTAPVLDPDTGDVITPGITEMVVTDGPRLLNAEELVKWDAAEEQDAIDAARNRSLNSVEWAEDKANKLRTKADESEAIPVPTDNASALVYLQWLHTNIPIWARWDAKVYDSVADALFGSGEADPNTQEPI